MPLVMWLFEEMGRMFKYICPQMEYIIDSFPLKVCLHIRISRSRLYADSACTDYTPEDLYKETEGIELMVSRKSNSKQPDKPWTTFVKTAMRKRIETAISEIKEPMPLSSHAVTASGFLRKVLLFIFPCQLKTII